MRKVAVPIWRGYRLQWTTKHDTVRGVSENKIAAQRSFGERDRNLGVCWQIPCLVKAYVTVGLSEQGAGSQEYKQRRELKMSRQ